jgi:hypothetical protein
MNETAYNNWIHEQLEPEDRLPHFKQKVKPKTYRVALDSETIKQLDRLNALQTIEQSLAIEDAYLAKHGIL